MSDNALALQAEEPRGQPAAERASTAVKGTAREQAAAAPAVAAERDLRLDLFRGIALWLIFIDHIPSNIVNWVTIRNFGFSDATEIFIFISGYTAAFVYSKSMRERGLIVGGARILRRAWQIYVAHIFLFAIFMAQIAYFQSASNLGESAIYAEEVNALDFMKRPDETIVQALLLKFKPNYMDVLPLYIVLLLLFPPILWLLQRSATTALALSVALYACAHQFHWNLQSYPSGEWFFNPLAWQLLFVFGAWCALGGAERLSWVLRSRFTMAVAAAYLAFAFAVALTWYFPRLATATIPLTDVPLYPRWLTDWMYPIDKTNLDVLRFSHFLALAAITVYFVPRDAAWLKSRYVRPAILCGQHSLEIFCLGVFLSFAAHFVTVEYYRGWIMQIVLSIAGVAIMVATATLISWYRFIERGSGPPKRMPDADLAGGQV